jgi:hypothetical protein
MWQPFNPSIHMTEADFVSITHDGGAQTSNVLPATDVY